MLFHGFCLKEWMRLCSNWTEEVLKKVTVEPYKVIDVPEKVIGEHKKVI